MRIRKTCGFSLFAAWLAMALSSPSGAHAAEPQPTINEVLEAMVFVDTMVPEDARSARSLGTRRNGHGAVIDDSGLIVTVGYLLLEAEYVRITRHDGKVFPGTLVAYDYDSGFGLVRTITPIGVTPLRMGDSTALQPDGRVLVVGYGGMNAAMPAWVVARRDFAGYWEYVLEQAIFTAPTYPPIGGAALIDQTGSLVGTGSLVVPDAREKGTYSPGNMFIPMERLKPIMADLLAHGRSLEPARPWIGLYTQESREGLLISRVAEDGPAQRAGLKRGDVVLRVGDDPVSEQIDFYRKLWVRGAPGTAIPLTVRTAAAEIKSVEVIAEDRYRWQRKPSGN